MARAQNSNSSCSPQALSAIHAGRPSSIQSLPAPCLGDQGWQKPGTSVILDRLLAAKPGDIVLCHDGGGDRSETVAALRTAIPTLKSRGLVFVTL